MGCISLSNWKLCEDPLRSGPSESDRSLRMLTNAAFITAVFFVFFLYVSASLLALLWLSVLTGHVWMMSDQCRFPTSCQQVCLRNSWQPPLQPQPLKPRSGLVCALLDPIATLRFKVLSWFSSVSMEKRRFQSCRQYLTKPSIVLLGSSGVSTSSSCKTVVLCTSIRTEGISHHRVIRHNCRHPAVRTFVLIDHPQCTQIHCYEHHSFESSYERDHLRIP